MNDDTRIDSVTWRLGRAQVLVRSATLKVFGGLWYISVQGDPYTLPDEEDADDDSDGTPPRYSVHFDVGHATREALVGATFNVDPGEADFYQGVHLVSQDLTIEVLAIDGDHTKLRLHGKLEWDAEPSFEIVGWFGPDNEPPVWARRLVETT